jgi:hypothetical protein
MFGAWAERPRVISSTRRFELPERPAEVHPVQKIPKQCFLFFDIAPHY